MTLVLQPQNYFTIVHQIPNHLDHSTYYVQAVIRNAFTDAIIATVNLTDKGGQRFKYDWPVPADPSGQGFYVSIVTSVYTDSGYTTKSENYGDDENTYLVQERVLLRMPGGQGGMDTYDARRIFREEFAAFLSDSKEAARAEKASEEPSIEPDAPQWDAILARLADLQSTVNDLCHEEKTEVPAADYSPIFSRLDDIAQAIDDKPVTPKTDLSPLLDTATIAREQHEMSQREVKDLLDDLEKRLLVKMTTVLSSSLDEKEFVTSFTTRVAQNTDAPDRYAATPAPRAHDISKLSL